MSQRLKITLSDAVMAELKSLAGRDGVPIARIAAARVSQPTSAAASSESATLLPTQFDGDDLPADKHAPWIEPVMGDAEWRKWMWGSIVAPHLVAAQTHFTVMPHSSRDREDANTMHPLAPCDELRRVHERRHLVPTSGTRAPNWPPAPPQRIRKPRN
jgi:hypothetical protein